MSDKKNAIEEAYWDHTLTEGQPPVSVYALCKHNDFSEAEFYNAYASLHALENAFWASTVSEVVASIESDEEYASYDERQQLQAFYYTYFEHILAVRSRFLARFPRKPTPVLAKRLAKMQKTFVAFADPILGDCGQGLLDSIDLPLAEWIKPLQKKGSWLMFIYIVHFHLDDESEGFASTDALIEKSIDLLFEAKDSRVLESAVDWVRFMMGRKCSSC